MFVTVESLFWNIVVLSFQLLLVKALCKLFKLYK